MEAVGSASVMESWVLILRKGIKLCQYRHHMFSSAIWDKLAQVNCSKANQIAPTHWASAKIQLLVL